MVIYGITKAYDWYKRDKKSVPLTRKQYASLIKEFFLFLRDMIFDDGILFEMPFKLGSLQIVGVKDKPRTYGNGQIFGVAINWQETRKLWEEKPELKGKQYIYYTNAHTNGYRYKFFWAKHKVPYSSKNLYVFKISNENKRRIYENIMSGNHKYTNR